mgnify:CR=1 FL=1
MPEVIVYAAAGRTTEQKRKLLKSVSQAVSESFDIEIEHVVVQIVESALDCKAVGGIPFCDEE